MYDTLESVFKTLKKNGIDVTIYEKYNYLGGLLVHGIPDFRLPKENVEETEPSQDNFFSFILDFVEFFKQIFNFILEFINN